MPAWINRPPNKGRVFAELHHDIVNNLVRIEIRIPHEVIALAKRGEVIQEIHDTIDKLMEVAPV